MNAFNPTEEQERQAEVMKRLLTGLAYWCHKKTQDPNFYVPNELPLLEKKFERIEQQVLRTK